MPIKKSCLKPLPFITYDIKEKFKQEHLKFLQSIQSSFLYTTEWKSSVFKNLMRASQPLYQWPGLDSL